MHSLVLDQIRQSTRRRFLQQCGSGMGALALGSLLTEKRTLMSGHMNDRNRCTPAIGAKRPNGC